MSEDTKPPSSNNPKESGNNSKPHKKVEELDVVSIRFAGDSGDGMQLTGDQFTTASAVVGDDVATMPDYPAEIRAPAGTVAGVSGFQLSFGAEEIYTPGDQVDVLVAMNPAALKANLKDLKPNGIIIVNVDAFTPQNWARAGYDKNPLETGELSGYRVFKVNISKLTRHALEGLPLTPKQADRCKNFFALGLTYWLFHRPMEPTLRWLRQKFKDKPVLREANERALKAGWNYGETTELFTTSYVIRRKARPKKPGVYRHITGNLAIAYGLLAAAKRAGLRLFLGSYPITPASEILHELSLHRNFGVITFQAEDEIAAIGAAIGAAWGGALAVTTTSGPGFALKSEFLNLAVMVELPLILVDVQRAGPSTGMPTKTEQGDLLQALYGRNGESPLVVLAPRSPADCFNIMIEAARIAVKYMTPVVVLSDAYLANGAEPWRIPESLDELPEIPVKFRTDPNGFYPYIRDKETLARPWAIPGTPNLEHRIGGLEKEDVTGRITYDPQNHEIMVRIRAEKVKRVAKEFAPTVVHGAEDAELLIVGWGSTYGAIRQAVRELTKEEGIKVACVCLRYLNPLPSDLGDILLQYKKVAVVENNLGQLCHELRAQYLVDAVPISKVQGQPFKVREIKEQVRRLLK